MNFPSTSLGRASLVFLVLLKYRLRWQAEHHKYQRKEDKQEKNR